MIGSHHRNERLEISSRRGDDSRVRRRIRSFRALRVELDVGSIHAKKL
jgi:hypothetical protein